MLLENNYLSDFGAVDAPCGRQMIECTVDWGFKWDDKAKSINLEYELQQQTNQQQEYTTL